MVGTVNDDSTPPDDSISRIDALALVGGSMGYDEAGSADYLADCARGLLGQGRVEWTSHNEITIDCVVGPLSQEQNRLQPPSPEQLEQAIRSRLWEQARRGNPGVHVKGDSATYRAALVFVEPFGAWQLVSALGGGATPTGPRWSVEINFKLVKFRLSQLVAALRADGGLLEAGFERLRSLGRLPPRLSTRFDPPASDLPQARETKSREDAAKAQTEAPLKTQRSPTTVQGTGGNTPHPEKEKILAYHAQRIAAGSRRAVADAVEWTEHQRKAGAWARPLAKSTLHTWLREEKRLSKN